MYRSFYFQEKGRLYSETSSKWASKTTCLLEWTLTLLGAHVFKDYGRAPLCKNQHFISLYKREMMRSPKSIQKRHLDLNYKNEYECNEKTTA